MKNIGLLGTGLQILSNYAGTVLSKRQIRDVPENDNKRIFKPDSWIFSIWGLIYTSLFIGFQTSTGKRVLDSKDLKTAYIIASITNPLWIVLWTNKKIRPALLTLGTLSSSLL